MRVARIPGAARAAQSEILIWDYSGVLAIPAALVDPYEWLELVGTAAFAVSGAMVAVRGRMDWLGVAVLAFVTATGGGTLRDLLLGITPVTWLTSSGTVVVALVTSVAVIWAATRHPQSRPDSWKVVLIADAAGLAVFTTSGTLIALAAGAGPTVSALMGVTTGTAGGVLRDVLARQRPLLLVGEIYALAAAAGAVLLVMLRSGGVDAGAARWASIALILLLRLLALRHKWSLPRFRASEQG